MIIPNKAIPYNDSIICKMVYILNALKYDNYSVEELYLECGRHFNEPNEFLMALDVLYILDVLELNSEGVLIYVSRNA